MFYDNAPSVTPNLSIGKFYTNIARVDTGYSIGIVGVVMTGGGIGWCRSGSGIIIISCFMSK